MYHERLWLLSLHLIRCLLSSHARKPVMGKLQKGKTGRAPGPSEVLSKAFPFYALSHRYSSCQLKSEDGKNLGLEKNFSTSKRHLTTGLSFWKKKKEKKPETVGMERTSRRRDMLKNQIPRLENRAEMNVALCSAEKRNQTHTECVDSGLLLCAHREKSIWRITINMYLSFLYIPSVNAPLVCVSERTKTEAADRERLCVFVCETMCAHAYVVAATISRRDPLLNCRPAAWR